MMPSSPRLARSIALLPQGGRGWIGGQLYFAHLFELLLVWREKHPERPLALHILCQDPERLIADHPIYRSADSFLTPVGSNPWIRLYGRGLRSTNRFHSRSSQSPVDPWALALAAAQVDVAYPYVTGSDPWFGPHGAAWIPDFQHNLLPQFFSEEERAKRDHDHRHIAQQAGNIVFSSQDALSTFLRLYPESPAAAHVLSFCSIPDSIVWSGDPEATRNHYNLPRRFLLCSGQFWVHKNQGLVLEALAVLKATHPELFVVFTGHTYDYRAPESVDAFLSRIHELGLRSQVAVLGLIPRSQQLQLMRYSTAVIQPSLFEGWSTVVEDARALGKPLVLSDLPVHIEQNPPHSTFFSRTSAESLADGLLAVWNQYPSGPDLESERRAKNHSLSQVAAMGHSFVSIADAILAQPSRRLRSPIVWPCRS